VSRRKEILDGSSGTKTLLVATDVSDEGQVRAYVAQTQERFGRSDWFNNASKEGSRTRSPTATARCLDQRVLSGNCFNGTFPSDLSFDSF
jgi:NAD(P)-dependent dehydrogenase (short-subunit alcohol dehydrogenase family)